MPCGSSTCVQAMASCWYLLLTTGRGERGHGQQGRGTLGLIHWLDLMPLASSVVSTRWASSSRRSSESRTVTTSPSCWSATRQIWRHSARSGTLGTPSQPGTLLPEHLLGLLTSAPVVLFPPLLHASLDVWPPSQNF